MADLKPPTPPPDPPAPAASRPPIPKWRITEQDLWLDCLLTFSELLIQDTLSKAYRDERPWTDDQTRLALRADLEAAAILADGAIEETQYREFIQKTAPPRRRSRPHQQPQKRPGRGGPKGPRFRN